MHNVMANIVTANIDGLILAAGRSRRMNGGDKLLALLGGKTLVEHVVSRLQPQVSHLFINVTPSAGAELKARTSLDCPLIADQGDDYCGPLMGLWSALVSGKLSDAEYLAVVPCDGPFLPPTLVRELHAAATRSDADVACVRYGGVSQPTFSLWHKRALGAIEKAVARDRQGSLKAQIARLDSVYVDWPEATINPFFNINTPQELALAQQSI